MIIKRFLISTVFFFVSSFCIGQELEKLSNEINSVAYDEMSPVLSKDGHTLYFTRSGSPDFNKTLIVDGEDIYIKDAASYDKVLREVYSKLAGRKVANPASSEFNQDVWMATSKSDFFDLVVQAPYPLNNALPNSICAGTTQPNEYAVINQFPKSGGMKPGFSLIRHREDGSWAYPEPIIIENFYTNSSGVSLTMSSDGDVVVLSLSRSDARGSTDLYISYREKNGKWSEPANLGPRVNSPAREASPFLSQDGRTLFFASNRPGADGMDVYFTERRNESWTEWNVPQRLSAPINSPADDSQPHFNTATGYLYFSSNRDGSSDIYRVLIQDPQSQQEVLVRGKILNSKTKAVLPAKIYTGLDEDVGFHRTFYVSADGHFRLSIPKGRPIELMPEKEGFIGQPLQLDFAVEEYYFRPYEVDLYLDPISVDAKISLRPIFFEQSKPVILSQSYAELDRLAQIMQEIPGMSIRIEGHTDNVGNKKALKKLSEERAEAVRTFLVRKGVAAARIETAGFGGGQPVNDNMNEDQRRQNRRVEVRIVKLVEQAD